MFNITQSPVRPAGLSAVDMTVFVKGSTLIINDEEFDFSFMEKGSSLPRSAVDSPYLVSDVFCDESGTINLTLKVPLGPSPTDAEAFPPVLKGKKYGTVIDIHLPAIELPVQEMANG